MTVFRDMYGNRPVGTPYISDQPSRTKQSFKDECDINVIMRRYDKTGVLPAGVGVGSYADFSSVGSFQDSQNILIKAQSQFDALPARVRDRFQNDPEKLLRFIADKANFEEAKKLGLLKDEAKPLEVAAAVAPPEPAKPA